MAEVSARPTKEKFNSTLIGGGEVNEVEAPGSDAEVEAGEGDGKVKSARAGAAGIDVEDAALFVFCWFVSVAGYHDVKSGSGGIQVEFVEIVQHVDRRRTCFDDLR